MASYGEISWRDHSRETSHCKLNCVPLTAANVAAQETALEAVVTALEPLTFGNISKRSLVYNNTIITSQAPGDSNAQREKKAVVLMRDTTDQSLFKFELACMRNQLADNTDLMDGFSDDYKLSQTQVAALVTALEAFVYSPHGHAAAVERITYTGKRT
jgi:hypothetical protein